MQGLEDLEGANGYCWSNMHALDGQEYDARPDRYGPSVIGKYTKGIGQIEARMPTDDEDML